MYQDKFRRCYSPFKLIKFENGTTAFLPLNTKIGGPFKYAKDKEAICFTICQARHIYKKVESEGVVNIDTIKQEIEEDKLSKDNIDDKINPYHNIIITMYTRTMPIHYKWNSGLYLVT